MVNYCCLRRIALMRVVKQNIETLLRVSRVR
nr:MAG TPA: hypothetical protein [Caudoviricetes sp.]